MVRSSRFESYLSATSDALSILNVDCIQQLSTSLFNAYQDDQTIYLCGNGGSGTTANHLAQDLGKSTIVDPDSDAIRRLRVISLSENVA